MSDMTEPPHRAVISRLSADFATISQQLARASADLDRAGPPAVGAARRRPARRSLQPYVPPCGAVLAAVPAHRIHVPVAQPPPIRPTTACVPPKPRQDRSEGWIGKVLAVAGVAVTLIGVVLLLVLAAQAGILRPEFRVAGGAVARRGTGGHGVVAVRAGPADGSARSRLAATGVAAAYMDVIAVTTIYHWVPAPARAGHRRGHRRRRFDPGQALGFAASRPAGAGAADRAGAGRHRRHHAAARRFHAGDAPPPRCRCSSARTGSGCTPPASRLAPSRCSSRWPRTTSTTARSLAGGRLRHRGRVGDRSGR